MLYYLDSSTNKSASMISFRENASEIKQYFLWDTNDGSFLKEYKIQWVVKEGYSLQELENESFLRVDSELFVISSNAYEKLFSHLQNDVLFYACDVWFENQKFDFYVGKIITKRKIIDKERSTFWTFDDGVQMLQTAIFSKDMEEDFYLARDMEFNFRYAASSKFADLVRKNKLNISLIPQFTGS